MDIKLHNIYFISHQKTHKFTFNIYCQYVHLKYCEGPQVSKTFTSIKEIKHYSVSIVMYM